ncbi:uncharacterized protein [Macrobrachium rosenbergii]|uniref:uncharacterized protein n=1 Tax=Macrobrachium rosenbergii TaxID=79674 RepID=UPI0034D779D7
MFRPCWVLAVGVCLAGVAYGAPQQGNEVQGSAPAVQVPFVAGFTPEVQQARDNFQVAYNYLAQLALLAPDDPVTLMPGAETTVAVATATNEQLPPASVAYPPGYQFGGLTPEVAQATASFFQHFVAASNLAQQPDTAAVKK